MKKLISVHGKRPMEQDFSNTWYNQQDKVAYSEKNYCQMIPQGTKLNETKEFRLLHRDVWNMTLVFLVVGDARTWLIPPEFQF